jgi:hypothetical protein
MTDDGAGEEFDDVGEPVCWLNRVCEICGAIVDTSLESCWRCGTPLTATWGAPGSETQLL